MNIPNYITPGLIYGIVCCERELMGSPQKIPESGFAMIFISDVTLEQLQADYDELNSTYHLLFHNYTQLESNIEEDSDSSKNLMYVFIATTIVASITVIFLLMRKPKKIWI